MADTTTKQISELDFETVRNNIATFIANNSDFTDYNFEGSALSFLMDVLAFNTHYNAVYLNMAVNENFIDTAQIRSSVVSLAKNMGYTPRSNKSAIANISFTIPTTDIVGTKISIDNTTLFTSTNNGSTFVFSPTTTVYATAAAGSTSNVYTFSEVDIREGSYATLNYTSAGLANEKFTINNFNIDLDSIQVKVQNSANDVRSTTYSLISDITTLTPTTAIFYLFEAVNRTYDIQFGDGVLGTKLVAGNIVNITYQTSAAEAGNGCSSFTLASLINGVYTNSSLTYTNVIPAFGGQIEESIDSVRINSLQNFRTQGRAVTADDYKFFLGRDYPFASTISVWGGQDAIPPQYGKVFMSFKPVTGYTLSTAQKEYILSTVIDKYNIVSILPEIVDPEYIFLQIITTATFNSKSTMYKSGDIQTLITSAINNYNDTTLTQFGTNFTYSQFTSLIDKSDPSIIGNLTQVTMRKNIPVVLNASLQYTIDFQNVIHPGSVQNKYPFQAANDTELNTGTANLYIDDDQVGNVRIYNFVGTDVKTVNYINLTAGTVDYATGIITLNNFTPSKVNSDGTFDIVVKPEDFSIGNITSKRNTILTISPADILVSVTAN